MKRINLATVQQSAVVAASGYTAMPLRTGGESVVGTRTSDKFAASAKGNGKILSVGAKSITIQYDDGTKEGFDLGVVHGTSSGDAIPHKVITDMKVGDKVVAGDIVAWNVGFFQRDEFSPSNVVMKTGVLAKIALMENNDTLEDGSAISPRMSTQMTTTVSKRKTLLINYDQEVSNLVKVGDKVDFDTVLATIMEREVAGLLDEDATLAALGKLSSKSPKAKFSGEVTNMDVFYMGGFEGMSDSLVSVVEQSNKERAKRRRAIGNSVATTGEVFESTFIGGEKIIPGTVIITIYIDHGLPMGVGDKLVVGNQLKSVPGRVMVGTNQTEDGQDIDVIFSWKGVDNRIVLSPKKMGIVNSTMAALSKRFAEISRGA